MAIGDLSPSTPFDVCVSSNPVTLVGTAIGTEKPPKSNWLLFVSGLGI